MPVRDYQKSLIYAIRVRGTQNIIYIGSTTDLNKRRNGHKTSCNNETGRDYNLDIYKYIRSIGGWEMVIFEEVKKYPCNTKAELNKEEGAAIKEYLGAGHKLKNKVVAGRTKKEHYKDNRDKIIEQKKQYYEANVDKVKKKNKEYYEANADKKLEYAKEYREANADKIKDAKKEYREKNKDKIKETKKEQYKANADKIKEQRANKITCPCGSTFRSSDVARHNRTQRHLKYIQSLPPSTEPATLEPTI